MTDKRAKRPYILEIEDLRFETSGSKNLSITRHFPGSRVHQPNYTMRGVSQSGESRGVSFGLIIIVV